MKTIAFSVPPSFNWAGADGTWSTFDLALGSASHVVKVLPATSGHAIWVVNNPLGCAGQPLTTSLCDISRGDPIAPNSSTTFDWVEGVNTLYWLDFTPENALGGVYGYQTQRYYPGLDTVSFGEQTLTSQFIANYAATAPYVGLLGLTPFATNRTIGSTVHSWPSVLGTLASRESAPTSSYWAYTAGAYYRGQQYPGSLTFGGYDSARMRNKDDVLSVPTGTENTRDLVVSISAILIDTPSGPVGQPHMNVPAFIDSVVPEIWLTMEYCKIFEDAFGLEWDPDQSVYWISGAQHEALSSRNAKITFTLSSSTPTKPVNIEFPYEAFYQTISFPLAGIQNTSVLHYFPLKRASNYTQNTLGRVFLQEAYLAVDYNRKEFHLWQARFPEDQNESDIHAVQPSDRSGGLSVGAIVGIAIGAVALILIIAGLLYWFKYRPWSKKKKARLSRETMERDHRDVLGYYGNFEKGGDLSDETYEKREMDATQIVRGSIASRSELPSPPLPQYSPGSPGRDWPKDRSTGGSEMAEMGDYLTARRSSRMQSPVELSADSEHQRRPPAVPAVELG